LSNNIKPRSGDIYEADGVSRGKVANPETSRGEAAFRISPYRFTKADVRIETPPLRRCRLSVVGCQLMTAEFS
jgi:hypothetical protein